MRSDSPPAYAFAVSIALMPASRVALTMFPASASLVWSPNIIVPSQSLLTFRPLAPSDSQVTGVMGGTPNSKRATAGGDEALAQLALEHLADRAARQLGNEL